MHNGHWWKEKDGEGGWVSSQQYQHLSEQRHFLPSRQTESLLYVFVWKCMDECVCVGWSASLSKEVTLYNKHSHSSIPADLINKTRSLAYSDTHHPFPPLQVNMKSFQHKRGTENWEYLLPAIAPPFVHPPPTPDTHMLPNMLWYTVRKHTCIHMNFR